MFIYLMQAKVCGGFVVVCHPQAPKFVLFVQCCLEISRFKPTDTREGHDIGYNRGGVDI